MLSCEAAGSNYFGADRPAPQALPLHRPRRTKRGINAKVLHSHAAYQRQPFKTPLVLSSGAIRDLIEVTAGVRVAVAGREATGKGSIYLSDLWAWPGGSHSHEQKEQLLKSLCDEIARDLPHLTGGEAAHPMELGLRLHHAVCETPGDVPVLARAMCLSPFDAAIHDAVGIALEQSAFDFYESPEPIPSADKFFPETGASDAIHRTLLHSASRRELPACLIVGKDDVLERDVRPWALERGYRSFKLKLMGRDNAADVARTVDVYRAVRGWGVTEPFLSVDTNEGNPDAASVLDYLQRLQKTDAGAFAALRYLEQPTGRDIRQHRFDWREVSRLKPVMLDEGLTSLDLLPQAIEQGWSGLALKTCKGHSFALLAAAWAREHGMLLSLQDLTNPGYALIHAALVASNLPTINGVELNSPQFTPAANEPWLPRLAGLFAPMDGVHRLPPSPPVGLGSTL
jgi:L-alanine-DL-glutamate epimerase-like enolase superfamily enzyme